MHNSLIHQSTVNSLQSSCGSLEFTQRSSMKRTPPEKTAYYIPHYAESSK